MKTAIRLSGLTRHYGQLCAVDGLTLEVGGGEVVALLGPNGSGKSTVLGMAAGLVRPGSGTVLIGGVDPQLKPVAARRLLGFVPQKAQFPARLTCIELLELHTQLRRATTAELDEAIRLAGLPAVELTRQIGQLSGGMVQRLALAVGLTGAPQLLLFDEPSAYLDPRATLEFRGMIGDLKQLGRTVLFSSHELGEVAEIADRICIMVEGRLVSEFTGDSLRQRIREQQGLISAEDIYLEHVGGPDA